MEIQNLVPVDYANQRVLTSAQLAKIYECNPSQISYNFNYAKEQFQEGVHYFKLTGDALREFKSQVEKSESATPPQDSQSGISRLAISPFTTCLFLWTYQGCVRHCKMLNTQKAWDMFNELERVYFAQQAAPVVEEPKKRKSCSDTAHAYAFLMSDDTTKIGHSDDIDDRMKRMKRERGLEVMKEHHSPKLPREDARRIERTLHKKFARFKVDGEFFNADYADVCNSLDRATAEYSEEIITESTEITDFERGKELVKLIAVMEPSPDKNFLVRETANLLIGKKLF